MPRIMRQAAARPDAGELAGIDVDTVSYFLSRIAIVRTDAKGMRAWRKRLFLAVAHNAASPVDYFRLPADRSVIMGAHVPV